MAVGIVAVMGGGWDEFQMPVHPCSSGMQRHQINYFVVMFVPFLYLSVCGFTHIFFGYMNGKYIPIFAHTPLGYMNDYSLLCRESSILDFGWHYAGIVYMFQIAAVLECKCTDFQNRLWNIDPFQI